MPQVCSQTKAHVLAIPSVPGAACACHSLNKPPWTRCAAYNFIQSVAGNVFSQQRVLAVDLVANGTGARVLALPEYLMCLARAALEAHPAIAASAPCSNRHQCLCLLRKFESPFDMQDRTSLMTVLFRSSSTCSWGAGTLSRSTPISAHAKHSASAPHPPPSRVAEQKFKVLLHPGKLECHRKQSARATWLNSAESQSSSQLCASSG